MNTPHFRSQNSYPTTTKCFITTCIYYIYSHFLSDIMNDWQLLNNLFVNNAIFPI